jgi:hypothetical protein
MKKLATLLSLMVAFIWIFSACAPAANATRAVPPVAPAPSTVSKSAAQGESGLAAPSDMSNAPQAPGISVAPAAPVAPGSNAGVPATTSAAEVRRIVIKNATLAIVVKDPAASMDRIGQMAEQMGGFIISSNIYKTTSSTGIETPQAEISIRVPADKLTTAIQQIKSQVPDPTIDILTENISGSDVTKEYTDLQSRLTNLQNAADQLKAIMAKADKTEDVMAVYNQLMQVNEQIEVIKGQIKYYDEASNMSQIAITLHSEASIAPLSVGGWKPEGVARDAVQALINTLQVLANVTIWLIIYFLPILIILALVVALAIVIIRAIIKSLSKSQKPKNPPPAAQ